MVPSPGTQRGGITKPALDFIGQHDGLNEPSAMKVKAFGDCKTGRNIVRRVSGFFGEVGVIEVEIPNRRAIGKSGQFRSRSMAGSPYRGSFFENNPCCQAPGDPAWRGGYPSIGTAQTIQDSSLDLMNHLWRKVLEFKKPRIIR